MAGGIRRNAGSLPEENSDINIVPFIDIMLVLLIIFMVAAPLATVDVDVDLPASTAKPAERPDKPLYLTLGSDLALHLGDAPVAREGLAAALDAFTGGDRETRVFLRADQAVSYRDLMETMNLLRDSGYVRIALIGLEAAPAASVPDDGAGRQPGTPLP
ncbi:TonB system transport protein ExbD [Pleomorphomonas carboxyditropha]|uniref:Biopolymer transport protein ExbD n=1 Tax=Pleomorphomonas carboxyditropha TaxID=2023338 RepID=A0A2G9WZK8_9HYPH|nr:TonB system transport protein ExbD [Pleomorphomonas carboxyditropha]PIP00168.1 TonB system transport protein ExbD [Pleomorphomonas carboxyditropha]